MGLRGVTTSQVPGGSEPGLALPAFLGMGIPLIMAEENDLTLLRPSLQNIFLEMPCSLYFLLFEEGGTRTLQRFS